MDGVLSLLKVDEFLPAHVMENAENAVAKRIHEHTEYEEPVDECIKAESVLPDMYWSHFYKGLERKVAPMSKLSFLEQSLKIEEVFPLGRYEKVEEPLFKKIETYENAQKQNTRATVFFWNIVRENYKRVGSLLLVVGMALGIWQGSAYYQNNYKPITCKMYQVQGPNIDIIKSFLPLQGNISSELGGSMTMINKYGYVELQNGSRLKIINASEKRVHYKAEFAHADKQLVGQGSITFFVNKQKRNEQFMVSTGDYHIEVVGTYFKLQPDLNGHVAISVKEGQVKVTFSSGDVKILKAGQNMTYDMNYNSYFSSNDGTIVPRQEIEQFPDIHDLGEYQQVYVTTSVPNAGIRIDGKYVGMSPIIILQAQGYHVISVEKEGYGLRDTTIMLGAGQAGMYAIDLKEAKSSVIAVENAKRVVEPVPKIIEKALMSKINEPLPDDSGKIYFEKAEFTETSNWQEAVRFYQKVLSNRNVPALQKEAAGFSIAKLLADHGIDRVKAKEGFFNYLTMYPTGNFVGESWLRLAELEFEQDPDKAVEYYLKYFDKYPRHYRIAELQERVGLMYLQKKKYDEAINMFKLSLSNIQDDNQTEKSKLLANIYKTLKEKESVQQTRSLGTGANANLGSKR
jgi:tetratricopeptide (TPR) repeat protein